MHLSFVHPLTGMMIPIDYENAPEMDLSVDVIPWRGMPAEVTEIFDMPYCRLPADLSRYTAVLLMVNMERGGAPDAIVNLRYSLDGGETWDDGAVAMADRVLIDAPGLRFGNWAPLHQRAKANALLTIAGRGGDGKAAPAFLGISAQFR